MVSKSTVGEEESPAMAVVDRIADIEDVEPDELMPPLGTEVEISLLNSLVTEGRDGAISGTLEFTYREHEIQLSHDGTLAISSPATHR